jgi:hypothetical protein
MFQTEVVEKIKTRILCSVTFKVQVLSKTDRFSVYNILQWIYDLWCTETGKTYLYFIIE